jgi:hypothetical protein
VKAPADDEIALTQDEPYSVRLASRFAPPTASGPEERRQYSRRRDHELEWVKTVRLRTAGHVSLIDLSAGGALIDSDVPLRPGAVLSLEIIGRGLEAVIPLQILRCYVSALMADRARYRGACEFTRPIELPDFHPLPEATAAASDSFVGVDSALKRLIERAYSPDPAQRLAAGDVMLVLQTLARRALEGADPFGRQIGTLLQDLMPVLRHGIGLPAAAAAIERQLSGALPNARVRLVDGTSHTMEGMRSVLISLPGSDRSQGLVSIDVPSAAIINDAQARMLRTSSRLIALAQRLNGYGTAATPATVGSQSTLGNPDPQATIHNPQSSELWQKIVARYADGQLLKGFTQDFHGSKTQFSLWPSITAAAHERVVVPLAQLKAVFFVRDFDGNPDHIEQKAFETRPSGRRIEVTMHDGEVVVGTTLNYGTDRSGFFISPADPHANNQRIFVVATAVRQVRFP